MSKLVNWRGCSRFLGGAILASLMPLSAFAGPPGTTADHFVYDLKFDLWTLAKCEVAADRAGLDDAETSVFKVAMRIIDEQPEEWQTFLGMSYGRQLGATYTLRIDGWEKWVDWNCPTILRAFEAQY